MGWHGRDMCSSSRTVRSADGNIRWLSFQTVKLVTQTAGYTMRLPGYKKALPSEQSLDPISGVVRCYSKSRRVCTRTRSDIISYQYAIKFSGCVSCLITTVEHHEVLALHRSTPLALDVGSTSQRLGRNRYDSSWSAPCIPRSSSP